MPAVFLPRKTLLPAFSFLSIQTVLCPIGYGMRSYPLSGSGGKPGYQFLPYGICFPGRSMFLHSDTNLYIQHPWWLQRFNGRTAGFPGWARDRKRLGCIIKETRICCFRKSRNFFRGMRTQHLRRRMADSHFWFESVLRLLSRALRGVFFFLPEIQHIACIKMSNKNKHKIKNPNQQYTDPEMNFPLIDESSCVIQRVLPDIITVIVLVTVTVLSAY